MAFVDAFQIQGFLYVYLARKLACSRLNMDPSLSPELMALCESASHEQDPKKLLDLTLRINELLDQQNLRKPPVDVRRQQPTSNTA